jgi:ATP-dependent DNA helicase RecG
MGIISSEFNNELIQTLRELIRNWEYEIVEFKQASNDYDKNKIGQYFSAISNEASLKGLQHGWLVFGVNDKTRKIVGSDYRDKRGLESLKHEIAQNTTGGISFSDIFEVYDGDKRVVILRIPAAVTAMPTAWKGHWYGRDGESLVPLSQEELDRLRQQVRYDWSKQTVEGSSVKFLDKDAISIARENYKTKQNRKHISAEIDLMSDEEFLTKIKLIVDGKLTNAAMVLLGNPDHDNILEVPVRIMWRLYGSNGIVKDYFEFKIPYIAVVDKAYAKIRNLVYRYMPNRNTLFTTETQQYDASLLKELLNNCIAHMDYTSGGRIYLDEFEDTVAISNPGSFIPGDVRRVLKKGYRAPYYRNQLLSNAMKDFDMIINYLQQFGSGTKADFKKLLADKLSDVLDDKQKESRIKYYLTLMRRAEIIEHKNGNHRTGAWVLVKTADQQNP